MRRTTALSTRRTPLQALLSAVNTAMATGNRSTIITLANQIDGWNNGNHNPVP